MIFPRIRENLRNHSQFDLQRDGLNEIVCMADGYPEVEVLWFRGDSIYNEKVFVFQLMHRPTFSESGSVLLARNSTRTILNFDHELHGVNSYFCEAKNKHGLTRIFITVLIPGV